MSSFYGLDRLGSKTLQTNSASAVTYQVSYDAFGNQKSATGATSSPFGFVGAAGYQQDSDSGLMLLGHRYYDTSTGRFLTRDPAKNGSGWYDYCLNNPDYWVDGSGYNHKPPKGNGKNGKLDDHERGVRRGKNEEKNKQRFRGVYDRQVERALEGEGKVPKAPKEGKKKSVMVDWGKVGVVAAGVGVIIIIGIGIFFAPEIAVPAVAAAAAG